MKNGAANDAGVYYAQSGKYKGVESVFTHRDPDTGLIFGEDIPVKNGGHIEYGKWVEYGSIEFDEM